MTILQSESGTDFGLVGFEKRKGARYLVFPKSLKRFEDERIIGIKWDLVQDGDECDRRMTAFESNLSADELARYSRHLHHAGSDVEGQRRLKAARVLCIGAGGLGSPAALYLAAAGVGTIGLVDIDDVDLSNLQRQILHGTKDVGRPKLESARDRLRDAQSERRSRFARLPIFAARTR